MDSRSRLNELGSNRMSTQSNFCRLVHLAVSFNPLFSSILCMVPAYVCHARPVPRLSVPGTELGFHSAKTENFAICEPSGWYQPCHDVRTCEDIRKFQFFWWKIILTIIEIANGPHHTRRSEGYLLHLSCRIFPIDNCCNARIFIDQQAIAFCCHCASNRTLDLYYQLLW